MGIGVTLFLTVIIAKSICDLYAAMGNHNLNYARYGLS